MPDEDMAEEEQGTEESPDRVAWDFSAPPTPLEENQPGGAEAPAPHPPPPFQPHEVENLGPVGVPSPPGGGYLPPPESFIRDAAWGLHLVLLILLHWGICLGKIWQAKSIQICNGS